MPKRQKSLLGYFSLSESGKSNQWLDGSITCKAQAQHSATGTSTVELETMHPSIQSAEIFSIAANLRHKATVAQPDNQDEVLPAEKQLDLPVAQPEVSQAQNSGTMCSVSQNKDADSIDCSTAPEDDAVNPYEQQVH